MRRARGAEMPIAIRPFEPQDKEAWLPLWRGYLAFYETDLLNAVTEEVWRRMLDATHSTQGLGAYDASGRLVGFVHYLFHPVTWSIADRCYLEDLFVLPEARGTGAGRALVQAVYAAAEAVGADQVYWLTEISNETARHLYDRVGRLTPFVKYQR
jgi:GNAT superfamily N-acetyltransferase